MRLHNVKLALIALPFALSTLTAHDACAYLFSTTPTADSDQRFLMEAEAKCRSLEAGDRQAKDELSEYPTMNHLTQVYAGLGGIKMRVCTSKANPENSVAFCTRLTKAMTCAKEMSNVSLEAINSKRSPNDKVELDYDQELDLLFPVPHPLGDSPQ